MTTIVQAVTDEEITDVRALVRTFVAWRREQNSTETALVEPGAEGDAALEDEVGELPGAFTSPHGRLLIAYEGDHPVGCAALCDRGDGVCEVTRLFVASPYRGQRMGQALIERLLLEARAAGYWRMRLDTRPREYEVARLCECAGFLRVEADCATSHPMPSRHVVFERDLNLAA